MKQHRGAHGLLMVGTACLYNLVKGDLSKMMHIGLLADVVQLVLHAVESVSNQPNTDKIQQVIR